MKKVFFSLLAIVAIASCAKTEPTYVEVDSEIKIAPVTAVATKAQKGAIDGTTYPAAEAFNVYAYWANKPAGSDFTTGETDYLKNVTFVNKGAYWGGEQTYYWPKNGSLRFAAYSPADLYMTHDLATDVYELGSDATPFEYVNAPQNAYDILVAPTSESYTAETAAEKVSVVFQHALAWLSFDVQSTVVAADVFTIEDVTVNGVTYKGKLVADMKNNAKTWTPVDADDARADMKVNTESFVAKADPQTVDAYDNLVIPQTPTTVTVTFSQKGVNGTPDISSQTVNIPLYLDNVDDKWEPGKKYTYTILFDLDEILINPSVADWEEVETPVVEATAVQVSTADELLRAVAAGKSVRLTTDITLTEPVKVSSIPATRADVMAPELTVELNGKTITSTGDVFEVTTGVLNINGPGYVKSASDNGEPYCAVWAYGDAVVNIYGGEFSCGYPAGDYNDLIYAKDNAVINVYGGKFYNSGKEDSFVLNLKDDANAQMNVYGGSFEKFNPADNLSEGAGTDFVAAGYNVTASGDWYTVTKATEDVVLEEDADVAATFNVTGAELDGNDYTVKATEGTEEMLASSTLRLINLAGDATLKNVTLDGNNATYTKGEKTYGIRNIYIGAEGNYVIDNVVAKNATYALNVNTKKPVTLEVTNSVLEGWVSYGTSTTADFTNVSFECGATQKTFRPYGTTVLTNCSFEADFVIDLSCLGAGETIVFDGCTYAGEALTAENLTDAPAEGVTIR